MLTFLVGMDLSSCLIHHRLVLTSGICHLVLPFQIPTSMSGLPVNSLLILGTALVVRTCLLDLSVSVQIPVFHVCLIYVLPVGFQCIFFSTDLIICHNYLEMLLLGI